jgi:hypothetical protein
MRSWWQGILVWGCGLAAAGAASVGVNFSAGGTPGGTVRAEEDAGAPGFAQRNWNNLSGSYPNDPAAKPAGNPARLRDDRGAETTISVAWQVNNTWETTGPKVSPDDRLRKRYLDSNKNPGLAVEVAVSGIPYSRYDLVVYCDADGTNRLARVEAGGQTRWLLTTGQGSPDFHESTAKTAVQAVQATHVVFPGLTGRDITFRAANGASANIGVQAFQIRAVP